MIKKLIGILFALAALAVMVFAVLGRDRYRSLVWPDGFGMRFLVPSPETQPVSAPPASAPQASASPTSAPATDTLADAESPADPLPVQADYFEDADNDLPSDLFSEESY